MKSILRWELTIKILEQGTSCNMDEKQTEYHDKDGDLLELISATISGWSSIEENEKHIEIGADHEDLRTEQVGNMEEKQTEYHDEHGDLLELISATISGRSSIEENEKHIEIGADHEDLRTEQVGNMYKRSTTMSMELISATISGRSSIEENEKHIEMGADHKNLRTGQDEENDHAEKGNMDRSTTIRMVIS